MTHNDQSLTVQVHALVSTQLFVVALIFRFSSRLEIRRIVLHDLVEEHDLALQIGHFRFDW